MAFPVINRGLKVVSNPHFWVVLALLALGVVLHYPQQILEISSPSVFSFLGLTRHAVERILMLLPVSYAGFVFGMQAGLIYLAIASIIMIPRVFLISQYFPDALLETLGVIVVGVLINLWINGYRKERARRQQMLSELETAHQQLQLRTANLAVSEQRYRELFENAHDAIWVHDLDGNITDANRADEALGGYSLKELKGMNVRSFLTEDSLNLAGRIKRQLFLGEPVEQPYEQRLIRRDGTVAILQLTTNLIRENGKPTGFLHIARDVTKEKEMQDKLSTAYRELSDSHQRLKESQEHLIQAEKLTSLGQLAASVAHEVNNPLSGVLVYTQLLMKKIAAGSMPKETALEYLNKMEFELIRSTKLIRNLLDFARQSPPAFREVNINEIVTRSFDLAAHSAELQHVQVTKELDPSLPKVTADFDQLLQVCTNLVLNAIQAMPEGGKLTLRTSVENDQIKIEVQDTGYGISPENMRKLFTPFFTTKREVKGVGLGLAVSHGITQRHNGRIEVKSKQGEGSTFTVYLPVRHEPSPPVQ
jgi:PAS domain S-box-containing protein